MESDKENLLKLRHSCEHILTQAMLKLFPGLKMAMGPATEEGFYFDFDYPEKISEEDFPKIEAEMNQIIGKNLLLTKKEVSVKEARELFKDNPYKQAWLDEIEKKGEKPAIYWTGGDFVDLCSGPHLASTGEIGAFKLLSLSGAYWRGDEKNKMLTRIYGTAFSTKKELDDYLILLEEAERHDHRKLGKDLDLFVFSDLVGKGLPLLTWRGTTIRRELERFVVDEELKRGYQHVITPPLANLDLYRKSGHYPYYQETMYPPMTVDGDELMLRPMTCPHHFMLFSSKPRSYKELPLRMAELSPQFRYEKSGELTGLLRVRVFTLADAHIFTRSQESEKVIGEVLDLIDYINSVFGLEKGKDYRYRLSLGSRNDEKKYYKDDQAWEGSEEILRRVLVEREAPFYEAGGEAAFYGPKIDVQLENARGKEETAFTVQYDFVMPKRFNLKYTDKDGTEKQPVVIHRSSIGALERTMAFLIERFTGNFPVWLSPTQVRVIPISDKYLNNAREIENSLRESEIRVETDDRNETMNAKVRDAQIFKIPYMIIIGKKEVESEKITIRLRNGRNLESVGKSDFRDKVKNLILTKSLDLW